MHWTQPGFWKVTVRGGHLRDAGYKRSWGGWLRFLKESGGKFFSAPALGRGALCLRARGSEGSSVQFCLFEGLARPAPLLGRVWVHVS